MSHAVCSVVSSMSRPFAVAILVPIVAVITTAILLGLLGVFVVWLCIVAVLITAIALKFPEDEDDEEDDEDEDDHKDGHKDEEKPHK